VLNTNIVLSGQIKITDNPNSVFKKQYKDCWFSGETKVVLFINKSKSISPIYPVAEAFALATGLLQGV